MPSTTWLGLDNIEYEIEFSTYAEEDYSFTKFQALDAVETITNELGIKLDLDDKDKPWWKVNKEAIFNACNEAIANDDGYEGEE